MSGTDAEPNKKGVVSNCCHAGVDDFGRCQDCREPCEEIKETDEEEMTTDDDLQKRAEIYLDVQANTDNFCVEKAFIAGAKSQDAISRKDEREKILSEFKDFIENRAERWNSDFIRYDLMLMFIEELETGETK